MPATPRHAPFHLTRALPLAGATLFLAAVFFSGTPAYAQSHDGHGGHAAPASAPNQSQSPLADGEVKKVDKAAGKVTVSHGPLKNLGMPPMTMVFHLADPSLGNGLKPGDKLRFHVEEINGALTITRLERLR